jgi:hypothetical protein
MVRITLKEAQKVARDHGFVLKKAGSNEYRINYKGAPESCAAYEATIEDALDTGEMMESYRNKGIRYIWDRY